MKINIISLAIIVIAFIGLNGFSQKHSSPELTSSLNYTAQKKSGWATYQKTDEYLIKTQLTQCGVHMKTLLQFENLTTREIDLQVILKPIIPTIAEIEFQIRLTPKQVETLDCDNKNIQYGEVDKEFEMNVTKN